MKKRFEKATRNGLKLNKQLEMILNETCWKPIQEKTLLRQKRKIISAHI